MRIRVRAASVNFPDILMAQGKYQHRPELPFVVGGEMAGEVIAVGDGVTQFKTGDRVVGGGFSGAFAEEAQVPAASLRAIPDGADFATAASFTTAYLTAYVALVRRGELAKDEWLLVHGAAGGVGLAAVDLGRVLGAHVIATASSEEKHNFLKTYGAEIHLAAVRLSRNGEGADAGPRRRRDLRSRGRRRVRRIRALHRVQRTACSWWASPAGASRRSRSTCR